MLNFYSLNYYQQINYIFLKIQLATAIISVAGNIFVFIIFSRSAFKKYAYSFYFRIMAVSDTLVFYRTTKNWVAFFLGTNLDVLSQWTCTFDNFISLSSNSLSVNILFLIALDRMLTIVYPNRFQVIKKRWFQVMLVAIAFLLALGENIITPINVSIITLVKATNSTPAIQICTMANSLISVLNIIFTIKFIIVDLIVINIINIKMVRFIMKSRVKVSQITTHSRNTSYRDRKFAIAAIGLNVFCTILKLPSTILIAVLFFIASGLSQELITATGNIMSAVAHLHHGFSFFMNLALNPIFYEEFLSLIKIRTVHLA
jgi:hypothetical protein